MDFNFYGAITVLTQIDNSYLDNSKLNITTGTNIQPQRNASFELLRILAMLLIISAHFFGHGGWNGQVGVNYVFTKIIYTIFRPSVNIFVMISA